MIPGLGRYSGEGISYPLQYSWASPVAQMVKILPTMWETWVQSLGWKDALEEGMATHSKSCLENPHGQRSLAGYSPWGNKDSDMTERLSTILPFPDLPQGHSPSIQPLERRLLPRIPPRMTAASWALLTLKAEPNLQ